MGAPTIHLEDIDLKITEAFDEEAFLASQLAKAAKPYVQNGEYHSFYTDSHRIGGKAFILTLFFRTGELQSVHLSPMANRPQKWEDVTHNELRRVKDENDRWMEAHFGFPVPAGVDSVYDEKSWSAAIIVTFR
jgi:hypothetical protein